MNNITNFKNLYKLNCEICDIYDFIDNLLNLTELNCNRYFISDSKIEKK